LKLDAEQGPPTADAFANERSRAAQLASDVRVIRLIDDPPPNRLPLIGCEVLERGERCRPGGVGAQRLDPLEGLLADLDVFHAQRATRAILHDATPPTVDQLAARDREQARDRLRDVDRALAPAMRQSRGERLRGQIGRDLGVERAAHEERQHRGLVALIEHAERLRVITNPRQQLTIGVRPIRLRYPH
jgi:hypothetical protein